MKSLTPFVAASLSRRAFLKSSAQTTAGVLLASGALARSADTRSSSRQPCAPGSWNKRGIILEPSKPWEGNSIQNFTTPAEPLANGGWRFWYSVADERKGFNIAFAEGTPGEPMLKIGATCTTGQPADTPLAIGNLPNGWHIVQPIHIMLPNGKHRLYFWAHGRQICRYLAAESDDGRRYNILDPLRPVLWQPQDRAAFGVPSPDGVMYHSETNTGRSADEPPATPALITNDVANLYQLPDGTFELYAVGLIRVPKTDPGYISQDNAPGLLRVIDRFTSDDGLHFKDRQRVIQRDAEDPADLQFYYLSVTHTPKGRVGLLGHYRCIAQTMDVEWCFSKDGISWERPLRQAWIPRGIPPAPDCYGIYAGHQLQYHDGLWQMFYTGVNSAHNGKHAYGKPRQVIMHATTKSIWA